MEVYAVGGGLGSTVWVWHEALVFVSSLGGRAGSERLKSVGEGVCSILVPLRSFLVTSTFANDDTKRGGPETIKNATQARIYRG